VIPLRAASICHGRIVRLPSDGVERRLLAVARTNALEEAPGVIANGYLRLDPQEWIRAVEKRRAALGG
jgi:hypothetical protein